MALLYFYKPAAGWNFDGEQVREKQVFLTAVYILLVPIPGLFLHKKCGIISGLQWICSIPSQVLRHGRAFLSCSAWVPIFVCGNYVMWVGYTLQIIGQNGLNPTVASLIMSLEAVFSAVFGWLILGQKLNAKEMLGCCLSFLQQSFSAAAGTAKSKISR